MASESFVATAWNNGNASDSGAGYGLKIGIADRDRFFQRSWRTVTLRLAAGGDTRIAEVNCAKDSFWNGTCRELIGKEIGRWFIDNGAACKTLIDLERRKNTQASSEVGARQLVRF